MTIQRSLSPTAWAQLGLLACFWGGSFLAMRVALDEIGPLTVVAHRAVWAALILWTYVLMRRLPLPRDPRIWGAFLVMGLLNNVLPFTLIAWGQQYIPTGLASILNASTAIFGVLAAAAFFADERLTLRRAAGVAIGFLGVATAIGLGTLASFDLTSLAQLAVLGAACCYALAGVWARKRLTGLPPQVAAAGMLTGAAILILPMAIVVEGMPDFALSARTWTAIAYYSVFATALAFLLYYRVLALAGSGNLMLATLLVAPVAIVLGALVLGEDLSPRAYAGFVLLAAGLLVLDGRLLRRRRAAVPPATG